MQVDMVSEHPTEQWYNTADKEFNKALDNPVSRCPPASDKA